MARDTWNPEQYEKFRDERSQPFYDLMALLRPKPGMQAIDLGCGTGELTRQLHRHLQASTTLGIDNSEAMLVKSQPYIEKGLRFEKGDIREFQPNEAYDLVFSNAALHWIPDHPQLFRQLTQALRPGGQLAVHLPANHFHATHQVAHEVASQSPFREALLSYTRHVPLLTPRAYAELFERLGYREQTVQLRVYGHRLASREDLVQWVKGSLLTDYEKRLSSEMFHHFLDAYREQLFQKVPDVKPFFFTFERLLLWGQK